MCLFCDDQVDISTVPTFTLRVLAGFVLFEVFYCVGFEGNFCCGRDGLLQQVLMWFLRTINSGIVFIFLFQYLPWLWSKLTSPKNSA
jgi:hypothetical protein